MSKVKLFATAILLMLFTNPARAEEGMWLLSLLEGYTIEDMQEMGFKLTAEDIYSVNQACLKDAVVIFDGGCTGEIISGKGLLLTNHHCGFSAIQSHSTVENDYLTDGFWAMSREEELPNPRLSVRFLRYMKDVGEEVLSGTDTAADKIEKDAIISLNIDRIAKKASEDGKYESLVKPMFYGNQYYLFVYERFTDVRLVGAPPGSIGNFGSDHDNWMWPRHTGDFSLFRIYANQNNEPAEYSPDNVPYKPLKYFEISLDGVEKGDFTMLLGYPGSTQQFLYSKVLKTYAELIMPMSVRLRAERMEIMNRYMSESDEVRIMYASKYRRLSNMWKKWQGAIRGLERLNAIEKKKIFEDKFAGWVSASPVRTEKYGEILHDFEQIYATMEEYEEINNLMNEAAFAVELIELGLQVGTLMKEAAPAELILQKAESFYQDYYHPLDMEVFAAMMKKYRKLSPVKYHPDFFVTVDKVYNGDFEAFARSAYSSTPLQSMESLKDFLDVYERNSKKSLRILQKDPVLIAPQQFADIFNNLVAPQLSHFRKQLDDLYHHWVQGRFEMLPDVRHYPDANFTMRLTYGQVEGYFPRDGVKYDYYTTLEGVMEKNSEKKHDYQIPDKLKTLYEEKDFGEYGLNGLMPVCFTASNHTSGGNSGSPVIDAYGRLVGINFDRNWHGTMSDQMYDPDMCRNISVDIRYVLFIIDRFAGAGYLLQEMQLHTDR